MVQQARSELEPGAFVGDWRRGRIAGYLLVVALALLSAVVKKGDAYLFAA